MHRKITLEQVKRELRARACRNCPLRTPGRPGDRLDTNRPLDCERTCELFEQLPKLTEFARQLDPMLRSVEDVLQRRISQTIQSMAEARSANEVKSSPLNRHRDCVVEMLTELVNQ